MTFNSTFTTSLGYTPLYRIDRAGIDITSNFEDRAVMIMIESYDGSGNADRCDITLDDRDWKIASPSSDESGTTLDVSMGYKESGLYDQGTFQVTEVHYSGMPKRMRLVGTSVGFESAAKSPLITSYDGKTLGDIVGSIAQAAGVSPSVSSSMASQKIQYLNQHQSAIHLLQELERRYNGLAKFSNGMLSFTERGSGDNASGDSIGTFTLDPEDLAVWDIKESRRTAFSKTRASYWDKTSNSLKWLQNSGVAGAPNASVPFMVKRAFNTQAEAQSAADAQMAALNRGIRTGSLTLTKGDPSIRGGMTFTIENTRDGVDGTWSINHATHTFTKEEGITTSLEFHDQGDNDALDI